MNGEVGPKTILITGGSGGIGVELVARSLRAGARVVATSSSDEGARRLRALGMETEGDLEVLSVDLSSGSGAMSLIGELGGMELFPQAFVGLASGYSGGPFETMEDSYLDQLVHTKVWSSGAVAAHIGEMMARRGQGRIVFVTGITGREPIDGYIAGAAANASLRMVSKVFSRRWADRGVTVNAVCPGPVETPRLRRLGHQLADSREGAIASGADHPLGRLVTATEVVNVIAFLLSDAASGVNGAELVVDGGYSRAP